MIEEYAGNKLGAYAQQKECADNYIVQKNMTVGENIDNKIEALKREIQRLEDSKVNVQPLLHMKISSIREAMTY